jgi:hypothetical protein
MSTFHFLRKYICYTCLETKNQERERANQKEKTEYYVTC